MNTLYDIFALLWRLPGFIFSFLFYRTTRFFITKSVGKKFNQMLSEGQAMNWVAYSETLNLPGAIPYMMCTTSRWNPHAPLGMFGPFNVRSNIEIQLESANRSASAWIITIYRGDFEIVKILYPANTEDTNWTRLNLPQDQYLILIRYYGHQGDSYFPGIKADGETLVNERNVGNEYQKGHDFFADNVVERKGIFFFFTQYYIYQLLRWQNLLPPKLVRQLYLPVGDPKLTSYRYGVLEKGRQLEIDFDESLLKNAQVYVTYCNRWGFPSYWDDVKEYKYKSKKAHHDLVYLVRVVNYKSEKILDIEDYGFNCLTH